MGRDASAGGRARAAGARGVLEPPEEAHGDAPSDGVQRVRRERLGFVAEEPGAGAEDVKFQIYSFFFGVYFYALVFSFFFLCFYCDMDYISKNNVPTQDFLVYF